MVAILFSLIAVMVSNNMSNTAAASILPVSTPANAIAHSTGYVEQKDFRSGGLMLLFTEPLAVVLWVWILF